jgi:hypothetical protein
MRDGRSLARRGRASLAAAAVLVLVLLGCTPGPTNPPPADLWSAPTDAVPATGNYLYLEGAPGNSILDGRSMLFASPTPIYESFAKDGPDLAILTAAGTSSAGGNFAGFRPSTHSLTAGYYAGAQLYPGSATPSAPAIQWSLDGHWCYQSASGWFSVDEVSLTPNGALQTLSLRSELRCDGESAPLHAQVRWSR